MAGLTDSCLVLNCRAVTIILQHINILRRALYCSVLCVLCEQKMDHWNVNVDKLLFLYETKGN